MLVIDTNIFIDTFINRNNTLHKSCLVLMKMFSEGELKAIVPGLVLAEIAWLLHSYYGIEKDRICELLESIETLKGVTIVDGYNYSLALTLYKNKNVKYIDACIAALPVIQQGECLVVSSDRDFDKLGLKRVLPHELVRQNKRSI